MSTEGGEFRLPDLGEGLTEAEIVAWLVRPGDMVDLDQPVVVVETTKATVELPSPCSGVVTRTHGEAGDVVEVGGVLLSLASPAPEAASAPPAAVLVGSGAAAPASGAAKRGRVLPPGAASLTPSGVPGASSAHGARGARGARVARPVPQRASAHRRAVAEKLTRTQREVPAATCWVDADATGLLAARDQLRDAGVGLLALLARITVSGLRRFPELNSRYDEESGMAVPAPAVHLGIAVDTPRGLLVPVVRDAQDLGLRDLDAEISRLTLAAREGRLELAALTGSTMTLNNFGAFGVDGSTPLLNHPEAAMLGVGRIAAKPWVVGDELVVRRVVHLSVTFDHRVCDGAAPSGLLRHVADCVEQPLRLLLDEA
ncbi:dihydrolipoamide acetyltransferase family protein [Streptacidiphilus fuscans]|uniref:Dihydrolipoamide acetyltransferase component of pyruvate dehydrogenase complex n=1 Tax=Streptacidiphilus fuscans TaxID=2789292 RepID=A0A931B9C4_9ACTN|nr:dihydrolipoamide acetyltransferase family protein [Streptacidiphilus fuscans]MBF9070148.1 2-oxo acid dehydrogenase subunit E2 [Streptacidiphilus fuscans]